jgi:hypothetical protein
MHDVAAGALNYLIKRCIDFKIALDVNNLRGAQLQGHVSGLQ